MEAGKAIEKAANSARDRVELWSSIINDLEAATCAELGVEWGSFAEQILRRCNNIDKYYMIDPWRHLDDWNKPANKPDDEFAKIKAEAMAKTEFAARKRIVLQGKTTEVADKLPDESLDFIYVDGDHTLRGITIDLARTWPKVRNGGVLAGDDFCKSIWQHEKRFEPTLVFPLAVHFAEAMNAKIHGLPFSQFAIVVDRSANSTFEFHDHTGSYNSTTLREAMKKPPDGLMKRVRWKLRRLLLGN